MIYLLLMLLILIPIGIYIYHWLSRLFRAFRRGEGTRAARVVKVVLTVLLSILTMDLFSMIGIVLLHFWVISAAVEFIVWLVGKIWKNHPDAPVLWRRIYRISLVPALIVAAMMLYGFYNMSHIVKTSYTVHTDKMIREEGYHVLLLTDVHYGAMQDPAVLKAAIDELNGVKPDLVILGGDIVEEETSAEELREVFGILGKLDNRLGIYYVYGNHDRQPYTGSRTYTDRELEDAIAENGIRILENECLAVTDDLLLVGRGDSAWGNVMYRPSTREILGDVDRGKLIITVDHQPVEAAENGASGVDVQLSGHTHAGQIWPTGMINRLMGNLNYGEYEANGNHVFVSSGVAGWRYPVRTGRHCEYVVLDILKAAE